MKFCVMVRNEIFLPLSEANHAGLRQTGRSQYYKLFLFLSAMEKNGKSFMPLLKQSKGQPLNGSQTFFSLSITNCCTANSSSLSVVHCSVQQQKEQGMTAKYLTN